MQPLITRPELIGHFQRNSQTATEYMLDCAKRPFNWTTNRGLYELLAYGMACRQAGLASPDVVEAYTPTPDGWNWGEPTRSVLDDLHGVIGLWFMGADIRPLKAIVRYHLHPSRLVMGWATDKWMLLAMAAHVLGINDEVRLYDQPYGNGTYPIGTACSVVIASRRVVVGNMPSRGDETVYYRMTPDMVMSWGHAARAHLLGYFRICQGYGETAYLTRNLESYINPITGATPANQDGTNDGQDKARNMRFGYYPWMAQYTPYLLRVLATGRLRGLYSSGWDDRADATHGLGPMCLAAGAMEVVR